MKKQLSQVELAILKGACADLKRLRATPEPEDHRRHILETVAIRDAKRGIVKIAGADWTGLPMTSATTMALSRAYESLEKRGLLTRVSTGFGLQRCTHLKPSKLGIQTVETKKCATV